MSKKTIEFGPPNLFDSNAIAVSFSAKEEISKPFEFTMTISSPKLDVKPEQVIGQPMSVRIIRSVGEPRYFHGYVAGFGAGEVDKKGTGHPIRLYRVKLVPWTWFMTRAARCFVYLPEKKEKTIQDVLDEVIKHVKAYSHVTPTIDPVNAKILKTRKVEHCVQYRETDFNFLTRTLERYGVYYYFKHTENSHTMVLSDQRSYPMALEANVKYPQSSKVVDQEGTIESWEHCYEFVSGKWEQKDYDPMNPSTNLTAPAHKHPSVLLKNNAAYELYDYPGDYVSKDDGEVEAGFRMEEEETRFDDVNGTSTCKSFTPGYCFKLIEHANADGEKNKGYLITSVNHSAHQPGHSSDKGTPATYTNSFSCIPQDRQFRAQRQTPHPILSSVQTAVVVGPPGEEIHTDELGRVKVRFHWDRAPNAGENHSCWMRVSQVHAGKGFGGIDIPRMGEEVIVSFIEGNLDRPIITGRVYNKEAMPPYPLPAEKTRSGYKSKTYKGAGYNELTMDDTSGKEEIRIHGQHDMNTTVLHDQTSTVQNDRKDKIIGNDTETVGKNQSVSVNGGQSISVGGNQTVTITGKQQITGKKTITIDAADEIKLVCGASSIDMKKDGTIAIKGMNISINGSANVKTESVKIDSLASGTNTIKGTMVLINS